MEEYRDYLIQVFEKGGFSLTEEQLNAFLKYYSRLIEKNQVMNLTAITEFRQVAVKHFLDSATLLRYTEIGGKLIDVGSGAGFPGIPLKIMSPETEVLLLDSLNKRVGFLNEVIEALHLQGVSAVHARAEEAADAASLKARRDSRDGKGLLLREQFDAAVSRAVANLAVLSEYCLPFVKLGGLFAAYKSGDVEEEVKSASHALQILGGQVERMEQFALPEEAGDRSLVIIRKVQETPRKYPRKSGTPQKSPL